MTVVNCDMTVGKQSTCNSGDTGDAGSILGGKIPRRRKWQPIPIFLPEKFLEQRSLTSYSFHGVTKSQTGLGTHAQMVSWALDALE